ncbi:MAG: TPM domain-containing protein [Candidatus Eremiobacteraeota bacterium]|nr:TPM domain-containing protein [Candidatus Eremiobacteraeota bacterium]
MRLRLELLGFLAVALGWPLWAPAQGFKVPPTPDHYVTDNAGALSGDTRASVENKLHAYETATGHQVVVWIGQSTGDVPLETWTGETASRWKIGRRGHDDGAVLFLFMQDHKVRIEVGYGLESSLTDADSHRIISDVIVPRMKAGDPNGAVSNGVAAMLTTITPDYKGVTPPPAEAPSAVGQGAAAFMVIVIGLTFLFLIFMVVMAVIRSIRYGYLVLREGPKAAHKDMKSWPVWAGAAIAGSSGSDGGGDFGGGFSAGGGDFGGGGASGSW